MKLTEADERAAKELFPFVDRCDGRDANWIKRQCFIAGILHERARAGKLVAVVGDYLGSCNCEERNK